ncbi:hypothetical protein BDW59DRAFT_156513 [Aspergillus cavernicola]|uniref:Uncharacterized protein n=1 Tax=Aspergillus cavernicola TaxID=176166 RepID=A0ABR4J3S7_9EURO
MPKKRVLSGATLRSQQEKRARLARVPSTFLSSSSSFPGPEILENFELLFPRSTASSAGFSSSLLSQVSCFSLPCYCLFSTTPADFLSLLLKEDLGKEEQGSYRTTGMFSSGPEEMSCLQAIQADNNTVKATKAFASNVKGVLRARDKSDTQLLALRNLNWNIFRDNAPELLDTE